VQILTGATPGNYYYSRDHLGSIRELTDNTGTIQARYSYDPFGRPTQLLTGDLDADFGFAGMLWSSELSLNLTWFRAYDPNLGRWLSRTHSATGHPVSPTKSVKAQTYIAMFVTIP
jgi:RHS repeat-associated protein